MTQSGSVRRLLRRLLGDRRGGTALTFAIAGSALLIAGAGAVDYARLTGVRSDLQTIADQSSLAAAREFRLGNANAGTIATVASAYASQALAQRSVGATVSPTVDTLAKTVTVRLDATVPSTILHWASLDAAKVSVQATAKVVGGAPLCVIGLDRNQQQTVFLSQAARLKAPGCAVSTARRTSGWSLTRLACTRVRIGQPSSSASVTSFSPSARKSPLSARSFFRCRPRSSLTTGLARLVIALTAPAGSSPRGEGAPPGFFAPGRR